MNNHENHVHESTRGSDPEPIIDDRRTDDERERTIGFVIAIDTALSGWGRAPNRSWFVVPFDSDKERRRIEKALRSRTEMTPPKRIPQTVTIPQHLWRRPVVDLKYARNVLRIPVQRGDHVSIRGLGEVR